MNFQLLTMTFGVILLLGCTSVPNPESLNRHDPLEAFNRTMFEFNYNILDPYILRPLAVAWRDHLPITTRNQLRNFSANLEEPASMINTLLRGDPYHSMIHFNRFFLNTLLGMGGLIDVASMANPALGREEANRFGGTLGYYKIGYGPYIIFPGYGSFTPREDIGDWVDTLYPILNHLKLWMLAGKWLVDGIEMRAQLLDVDTLLQNSSDPYIMVREAYRQHHDFIARGNVLQMEQNHVAKAIQVDLDAVDES